MKELDIENLSLQNIAEKVNECVSWINNYNEAEISRLSNEVKFLEYRNNLSKLFGGI